MIPDDVVVQVLVQCREHLIARTFEALKGVKKAVVHIYNSTSILQRDVVFHMDKDEIKRIAIEGTKLVKKYAEEFDGEIMLEYSPESFTGTEVEYALDICEAVINEWKPTLDNKIIINLPATVENNTPNVYADQVEWMHTHFKERDKIILSVHTHNDRGTGVAITELALLAGADRVEGTLFGNGERTGNVDILTLAYNMFSQGVNPELEIDHIMDIAEVYERCCKLRIPERHPYAGKLVFTAFSGSHQDAINKGIQAMKERGNEYWEVPYLPIDPSDIGREYEPIVRINSQSGKGGVAFVMDNYYGYKLPKKMHKEFAEIIQKISEQQGEVSPEQIFEQFKMEYLERKEPLHFKRSRITEISEQDTNENTNALVIYTQNGVEIIAEGDGNGPIDAVKNALSAKENIDFSIIDYSEHALDEGSNAKAAAYICIRDNKTGNITYGVGQSSNITRATIRAVFSAVNRIYGE
jgi:2-isopropylmalate synthase